MTKAVNFSTEVNNWGHAFIKDLRRENNLILMERREGDFMHSESQPPPRGNICNVKTHYHIKCVQCFVYDGGNLEIKENRQSSPEAELFFQNNWRTTVSPRNGDSVHVVWGFSGFI